MYRKQLLIIALITVFVNLCLCYQSIAQEKDSSVLVAFWFFGESIPNNAPLETIEPLYSVHDAHLMEFQSAFMGYPFHSEHPLWRKASMERRNAPTLINYRPEGNSGVSFENANMRGIQIKQPFTGDGGENTLVFHLSSAGFENLNFQFVAKDEGAAQSIIVHYAIEEDQWTSEGLSNNNLSLSEEYLLYTLDFSNIPSVSDNENLKIRIRFQTQDGNIDEGGRVTFNNISLEGSPLNDIILPPMVANPIPFQIAVENQEDIVINLNEVFENPNEGDLTITANSSLPEMVEAEIQNHSLYVKPNRRGEAIIEVFASNGVHDPAVSSFRVLVYPEAHILAHSDFEFRTWTAQEPEYSYPENMLFLQSNHSDPGLQTELLFPYFIPHNDYHADNETNIGFPYANTRRTRITALGAAGVSFINTGRDRDLGGALLAINTQNVSDDFAISWKNGTLLSNERIYAIRLQYRLGTDGSFVDFASNSAEIEYIVQTDGNFQTKGPLSLPNELKNQEYVQLLWRYYHIGGDSGSRPELSLGDIFIREETDITNTADQTENHSKIFVDNNRRIAIQHFSKQSVVCQIYDVQGRLIHTQNLNPRELHYISLKRNGVFVVRLNYAHSSEVHKIVLP